jgi:hypothetical protein
MGPERRTLPRPDSDREAAAGGRISPAASLVTMARCQPPTEPIKRRTEPRPGPPVWEFGTPYAPAAGPPSPRLLVFKAL